MTTLPSCTVEGCQLAPKSKGLCGIHYMRKWRYGDPLVGEFKPCVVCKKPGRSTKGNSFCSDKCWKEYKAQYDRNRRKVMPRPDRSEYFKARKGIKREYDKRYRASMTEEQRERKREWSRNRTATRPDYSRQASMKRYARKRSNGIYRVTERDIHRLLTRYNHRCAYCNALGRLHLDHIIPIARGGSHSIGNLLPACPSCNQSKNHRTVMEWRLGKSVQRVHPSLYYT